MPVSSKKAVNPILIPIVSAPHFIFGCYLAAFNWNRLGCPEKAVTIKKWGIIGTVFIFIVAYYFPIDILKKMWSIGLGINFGVGMALRTLQLPEYNKSQARR